MQFPGLLAPSTAVQTVAPFSVVPAAQQAHRNRLLKYRGAKGLSTRNSRVACIGDSTSRGQSTGAGTSQAINAWPMQLARMLNASGVNAGAETLFGDGGSWGLSQTIANMQTGENRLTITGSPALNSVITAGGNAFQLNAAGDAYVFTPTRAWNAVRIFFRDGTSGRNFTVQIGSNAATTINSTTTSQIGIGTASSGTAAAVQALTLGFSAGTPTICGVECYDNARTEVTIWNWGVCGATSTTLLGASNTDQTAKAAMIATLKPDLAVIEGGIVNDWRQSIPVATTQANLIAIGQQCLTAGGDVLFMLPPFDTGSAGLTAQQATYCQAMIAAAAALGVGVYDTQAPWQSATAAAAAGFNSDTIHPTYAGYNDMARGLVPLLS